MTLSTYDPNIRWAKHEVEITYQSWHYTTSVIVTIKGNCKGFSIIESALSMHADQLFDAQGECPQLILTRPAEDGDGEDTLETTPDDDIENWLESMCVGVRIVGHIETAA